ncbi:hypothetical protein G6N76_02345 [Rhizobium daejeonense]|uniref:ABM domain-containing protein n=1 Tax=Rhizobium daejeonense TaxID=240521 RepID=A0A6M1RTT6_9HYPH|nr:hypothetical protein [Rhizobium daejeonense]NGO62499.1 hypothetical protein [Rhizobium daejeonense]
MTDIAMTDTTIFEIAVCTIADEPEAEKARKAAMKAVRHYPGFISWQALTANDRPEQIADIVEWASREAADAAAEKVRTDPAFAPYMAAIVSVSLMQHFHTSHSL